MKSINYIARNLEDIAEMFDKNAERAELSAKRQDAKFPQRERMKLIAEQRTWQQAAQIIRATRIRIDAPAPLVVEG